MDGGRNEEDSLNCIGGEGQVCGGVYGVHCCLWSVGGLYVGGMRRERCCVYGSVSIICYWWCCV